MGDVKKIPFTAEIRRPPLTSPFDGLTSDSYYIDVSSDGKFTGCIPFTSFHLLLQRKMLYIKIYGTKTVKLSAAYIKRIRRAGRAVSVPCALSMKRFIILAETAYMSTQAVSPELYHRTSEIKRFTDGCA